VVAHMIGGNEELSRPVRLIRPCALAAPLSPRTASRRGPGGRCHHGRGWRSCTPACSRSGYGPASPAPSLAQHVVQALVAPPRPALISVPRRKPSSFRWPSTTWRYSSSSSEVSMPKKPREALGPEARAWEWAQLPAPIERYRGDVSLPGLRVAPHRPKVGTGDEARLNCGARRRVPDVPELPLMASAKRSPSRRGGPRCNPPCTCGSSS